jgi:alkylhydroperoxidase family enzyme
MIRFYALVVWEETPFFTEREGAALAWTEAVTKVGEGHVEDSVLEHARRYFSEKELVDLTLAIVAINGWNRLAISFRTVPGTYSPVQRNVGKGNTDAEVSQKESGQGAHG